MIRLLIATASIVESGIIAYTKCNECFIFAYDALVGDARERKNGMAAIIAIPQQFVDSNDPSGSGFQSLFDNFFSSQRPLFSLSEKVWNPPADVYETANSMVIKMEIAGVSLNDLDITVQDRYLVVRGRRRENPCLDMENFHLMEIRYGMFERAFPLPGNIHLDEIQAQYSNGFLIVMMPKKAPVSRDIPVRSTED